MDLAIDEEETGCRAIELICGRYFPPCVNVRRYTSGGFLLARTNGLRCEGESIADGCDFLLAASKVATCRVVRVPRSSFSTVLCDAIKCRIGVDQRNGIAKI